MLQSRQGAVHLMLHILRKRGRHSSDIHLIRVKPLRLNENLMPVLIRKLYHLILNGRTVTRPGSLYDSRIDRRPVQIIADNLMRFLICVSQPAGHLVDLHILRICCERKRNDFFVSLLLFHLGKINRTFVNSCRGTGLEAEHFYSMCQ